jgi:hypothetical protein
MSGSRLTFFHASPGVETVVTEWFASYGLPRKLDGERSVRIAHPDYPGRELKIKGAGCKGGPVRFGTFHQSNLKAPVFDFEGRMMEDVAAGHDSAFAGGLSFQQAIAEHRMSVFLQRIRVPHVPCIGYGKVETEDATSWFSLHDWDPRLVRVTPPHVTAQEFATSLLRAGNELLALNLRYNIVGNCAYAKLDSEYLFLDLHFFRQLDAFNVSQISWAMHVIFNLHLIALDVMRFLTDEMAAEFPPDVQAYPFRCILADATRDDHEHLRWTIVAPYMLKPPPDFSMRALCDALARNRISRSLLDLCPREFARP